MHSVEKCCICFGCVGLGSFRKKGSALCGEIVKTTSNRKRRRPVQGEMRAEYCLDYGKARPNRFVKSMKGSVVLDPDVAAVFQTSEAVNALLRSVIAVLRHDVKRESKAG